MMWQLPQFPENHNTAAMAPADMTVVEWQRAPLKWLQQKQQQQSYFAAVPTTPDVRSNTFSVFPASTAAFHTCSALGDEEGSAQDLSRNMSPDLIHYPIFGSSFVSGGEGSVVEGGDEPVLSTFSCPPVGAEAETRATPSAAASSFDKGGAGVAAAVQYYYSKDGGRESSRKRKASHEASAQEPSICQSTINILLVEKPEEDDSVNRIIGDGCYTDTMIVPKLETDQPISSTTTAAAADGRKDNSFTSNKEASSDTSRDKCSKVSDPPTKTGYIQVRARHGQATDSHSLAERARREKISKRMKLLQDLVPGCSGITGKARVLDEIINYVQSLQRQLEFLSMRLDAVHPILDANIDAFLSKEIIPHRGGVVRSLVGTFPLEPIDASFLNHASRVQTQQAVAAPTAVECSSSLNEVAVSSSCPSEQASLLHATPGASVSVSKGCLGMDPYKVHALAPTSLWEADLHSHYRLYE